MTNREKLQGMAMYDLLVEINTATVMQVKISPMVCIMDGLQRTDIAKRCKEYVQNCEKCIAAWLNEEVRNG